MGSCSFLLHPCFLKHLIFFVTAARKKGVLVNNWELIVCNPKTLLCVDESVFYEVEQVTEVLASRGHSSRMPSSSTPFSLYPVGILYVCCVAINNVTSGLHGGNLKLVCGFIFLYLPFTWLNMKFMLCIQTNFSFQSSFISGLKLSRSKQCIFILDMQGNALGITQLLNI